MPGSQSLESMDAIVVGGGPAGAVAALALRRRGWRARLVDRAGPGRPKCCGHCLHPRAVTLLEAMGFGPGLAAISDGLTRRGEVWAWRGARATRVADAAFEHGGVVVSRAKLDAMLIEGAARSGVEVVHGAFARLDGERLAVGGEELLAPLIVAADGVGSRLARASGLAREPGRKFGWAVDVLEVPGHPWLRERIAMLVAPGAYLGVVGAAAGGGDSLHLAACVAARPMVPTKPTELIAWFCERFGVLREALGRGWEGRMADETAIGPLPWRTSARTAGRVALVGDAAGYVEPFTGEGMLWAIESSLALASCTERPGAWGDPERARYEAAWRASVAAPLRRCSVVAGVVARPRLLGWLGDLASFAPRLAEQARRRLVPR